MSLLTKCWLPIFFTLFFSIATASKVANMRYIPRIRLRVGSSELCYSVAYCYKKFNLKYAEQRLLGLH